MRILDGCPWGQSCLEPMSAKAGKRFLEKLESVLFAVLRTISVGGIPKSAVDCLEQFRFPSVDGR